MSWRGRQMKRPRIRAGGFYFSRGFAARSRALRARISPLLRPARQNRHATQAKARQTNDPAIWSGYRNFKREVKHEVKFLIPRYLLTVPSCMSKPSQISRFRFVFNKELLETIINALVCSKRYYYSSSTSAYNDGKLQYVQNFAANYLQRKEVWPYLSCIKKSTLARSKTTTVLLRCYLNI